MVTEVGVVLDDDERSLLLDLSFDSRKAARLLPLRFTLHTRVFFFLRWAKRSTSTENKPTKRRTVVFASVSSRRSRRRRRRRRRRRHCPTSLATTKTMKTMKTTSRHCSSFHRNSSYRYRRPPWLSLMDDARRTIVVRPSYNHTTRALIPLFDNDSVNVLAITPTPLVTLK